MATKLDSDTTKPSTVEPGDAPADTTDPTEQASTVLPDTRAAAEAGHGTVNSAVPVRRRAPAATKEKGRTETYEATRPDGSTVTVTRDLNTGESKVGK